MGGVKEQKTNVGRVETPLKKTAPNHHRKKGAGKWRKTSEKTLLAWKRPFAQKMTEKGGQSKNLYKNIGGGDHSKDFCFPGAKRKTTTEKQKRTKDEQNLFEQA